MAKLINDDTQAIHDSAAKPSFAVTYENLRKHGNRKQRFSFRQMEIIRADPGKYTRIYPQNIQWAFSALFTMEKTRLRLILSLD